MTESIQISPIGYVHSARKTPEDDFWNAVPTEIELDASRFSPDSLAGLTDFSHIEVIFYMNHVESEAIQMGARHPRNRKDWPLVGIFAQRGKNRPNRLGTTVCRILSVEGLRIRVEGLDAIQGTPVLDIKPWVDEFAPQGPTRQPEWMTELMKNYWK